MKNDKAYICLENGRIFEGKRFGADGDAVGELVFNTSCGGFAEILKDSGSYGKLVLNTFPLVGNYGCTNKEVIGDCPKAAACIVREHCTAPSNFKCEITFDEFLEKSNIVGIYDVDTREITKILRDEGSMNALITSFPENADKDTVGAFNYTLTAKDITVKKPVMKGSLNHSHNVVMLDFGACGTAAEKLTEIGCNVAVMPCGTNADNILKLNPDGIILSDGHYNPLESDGYITEIAKLAGEKPIMAIGAGHILLALALGASAVKMKNGHRGTNQPVRDCKSNRTYITTQNHGFEVDIDSIKNAGGDIMFQNANDDSCEGIEYKKLNAFSVSFKPEASGQMQELYSKFVNMMEGNANAS